MQFNYGTQTAPVVERPRCWGRSYDEVSSECRRCGFQNSCKEDIIRANMGRPMVPQQPQYGSTMYGPAPTSPYAVPQNVAPIVYQPQQALQPRPMQMPQAVLAPQQQQQAPQVAQEVAQRAMMANTVVQQPPYGWLHDPLYYTMAATPPPVRPQMQGESFTERVVKNAGLAMVEALFGQCFLAVRQLVLPPGQAQKKEGQPTPLPPPK